MLIDVVAFHAQLDNGVSNFHANFVLNLCIEATKIWTFILRTLANFSQTFAHKSSRLYSTPYSRGHTYDVCVTCIIIRLTRANVWESMGEALQLHAVYKSRIFYCKSRKNLCQYYKSRENPYQVLQVTCAEHAMKSKVRMIKSLSP